MRPVPIAVTAARNDCRTAAHHCAGRSAADGDPKSYVRVPIGTCLKIVGGSPTPKR